MEQILPEKGFSAVSRLLIPDQTHWSYEKQEAAIARLREYGITKIRIEIHGYTDDDRHCYQAFDRKI